MTVTSPGNRNSKAIPKGSWPCLAGSCNSWLGCSHSQPPFTIPGKNKEKRMAELFCNFLTVVEFSLENFGMDSVHDPGLGPSPGSGVQKAQTHSGECDTFRELNWESGTNQDQKPPPHFGCVCPGVLFLPVSCPSQHHHSEFTQPGWDAVLGSHPTTSHSRAGWALLAQEQHFRAQIPVPPGWAEVPLPLSILLPFLTLYWLGSTAWTSPNTSLHHTTLNSCFPLNRWLRHSNNTLTKPILQELESPAASNTKATHSTAKIWEILTYFPLPPPTLQPFKHTH